MSKADGLSREVDGTMYGLCIEHIRSHSPMAAYIKELVIKDMGCER